GEYDEVKEKSLQVLENLASYSTIFKSIFILSRELKKVQRRVNALEKIFIPENENARKYITDRLEEIERDELYIKRLIQQKS
ncbi:MAG TPA: V-type ATP synthase subunit D, partial [Spirochaetota bacterium]|nr:V-type ATP synthase subunit D [Spirochaetota bacterium]